MSEYPPDLIFEVFDDRHFGVTCLSCDGLHASFMSGVDIETVNEYIGAHVTFHLFQSLQGNVT